MSSMHEPESSSPRLDRLLLASAGRQPTGLANRLFEASVPMLPRPEQVPPVLHRIGFRWLAAAAALLLAAGLSLRVMRSFDPGTVPQLNLAMVIEGSDAASLGEEIVVIGAAGDTRLDDLDHEMSLLLADARFDG
jgi:hypothetical protein